MVARALIRAQCRKVNKHFFNTLETYPYESALMLGNLLLLSKDADEVSVALIRQSLSTIESTLTAEHIKIIWQVLQEKLQSQNKLLNQEIELALEALQEHLMRSYGLYQHIKPDDLVIYGRNPKYYRFALVALIRQHLVRNNITDPFAIDFNYDLMSAAGAEYNYVYLSTYLQRCSTFPLSHITALCECNAQVADLILKDMANSNCYFALSRQVAESHAALRNSISQQWRNIIENYPLAPDTEAEVRQSLQSCQSYPEFADIRLGARVQSEQPPLSVVVPDEYINSILLGIAVPTSLINAPKFIAYTTSILKLGVALCEGTGVMTAAYGACISAVPITVPVLTLGALLWAAKTVNFPPEPPSEHTPRFRPQ